MRGAQTHTASRILAVVVSLTALAVSCDDDPASTAPQSYAHIADPDAVDYLDATFGVRLAYLKDSADFFIDADGDAVTVNELSVEVDGFGSHDVYVEEIITAASKGGSVLLHLEDLDSGETRFFDYDAADNYIAFGQDLLDPSEAGFKERGAAVSRLEDGRYTVWTFDDAAQRENEQTVADGYAALELVNQYSEFSAISPHLMMTAVALGHADVPEARHLICGGGTASRPPVCTIFKEFCDCAACQVLGRDGANCDLCPQL